MRVMACRCVCVCVSGVCVCVSCACVRVENFVSSCVGRVLSRDILQAAEVSQYIDALLHLTT